MKTRLPSNRHFYPNACKLAVYYFKFRSASRDSFSRKLEKIHKTSFEIHNNSMSKSSKKEKDLAKKIRLSNYDLILLETSNISKSPWFELLTG